MEFRMNINTLNEALAQLPYARVYQGPCEKSNEFVIEVSTEKGGKYSDIANLEKLAKKAGYKYKNYCEHNTALIDGDFTYSLTMYSDKPVRCNYEQNKVWTLKE